MMGIACLTRQISKQRHFIISTAIDHSSHAMLILFASFLLYQIIRHINKFVVGFSDTFLFSFFFVFVFVQLYYMSMYIIISPLMLLCIKYTQNKLLLLERRPCRKGNHNYFWILSNSWGFIWWNLSDLHRSFRMQCL
jgi:hypothetical protein